jgi:hypothetical protein
VVLACVALAWLAVACGPHRQPMAPPEPGARPAPVEIAWPDAGASAPADAIVGP